MNVDFNLGGLHIDNSTAFGTAVGLGASAVAGLIGLIISKIKKKKEFEKAKESAIINNDVDQLIKLASYNNHDFESIEDRSHALTLLSEVKNDIQRSQNQKELSESLSKFEEMATSFLDPDTDNALTWVRYLWDIREEKRRANEIALQNASNERIRRDELWYEQRKYETIADAVTKSIGAVAGMSQKNNVSEN